MLVPSVSCLAICNISSDCLHAFMAKDPLGSLPSGDLKSKAPASTGRCSALERTTLLDGLPHRPCAALPAFLAWVERDRADAGWGWRCGFGLSASQVLPPCDPRSGIGRPGISHRPSCASASDAGGVLLRAMARGRCVHVRPLTEGRNTPPSPAWDPGGGAGTAHPHSIHPIIIEPPTRYPSG